MKPNPNTTKGKREKSEYMKGIEQGLYQARTKLKAWVMFDYMRGAGIGAQDEFIQELMRALDKSYD